MYRMPLISILMNCFNGEVFLEEAINSVLKQTYTNWELIFWDNKSSDRSVEIISKFPKLKINTINAKGNANANLT